MNTCVLPGHRFYDARGDPLPGLLTTLPMSFSCLSQLGHLDLSFNRLASLPTCLLGLPALSSLLLGQNRISELPADIGRLSSLAHLSLVGNELTALPPSLARLTGLRTLDVSLNLLRHLPEEIGSLGGLVKLELSQNQLRQLPESMGTWRWIGNCHFFVVLVEPAAAAVTKATSSPLPPGSLSSLRELFIYSNDIRDIPPCLNKLPLLKIDMRGNPLGRPPTPPPLPPVPGNRFPLIGVLSTDRALSTCIFFTDPPETTIQEVHLRFNQRR